MISVGFQTPAVAMDTIFRDALAELAPRPGANKNKYNEMCLMNDNKYCRFKGFYYTASRVTNMYFVLQMRSK